MMLNAKLIEILACPACKAKVNYDRANNELICHKCKLAFPVKNEIPIMLIDQARNINDPS